MSENDEKIMSLYAYLRSDGPTARRITEILEEMEKAKVVGGGEQVRESDHHNEVLPSPALGQATVLIEKSSAERANYVPPSHYNIPPDYFSIESELMLRRPKLFTGDVLPLVKQISHILLQSHYSELMVLNLGNNGHPYVVIPDSKREEFERYLKNNRRLRGLLGVY